MNNHFLKYMISFTLIVFLAITCDLTNPVESADETVISSWILISYRDHVTNFVRFTPKTHPYPISVNFETDSTFSGRTSRNSFWGKYELMEDKKIKIESLGGTQVGETEWGYRFFEKFPLSNSYELVDDSLLLFLNGRTEILSFINAEEFDYEAYQMSDPTDTYYSIREEFMEYFGKFDEDSWWLYREVNTGSLDSMYVTSRDEGFYYNDADDSYNEYVFYILESTANDKLFCRLQSVYGDTASNFYFYYPISIGLGVAYLDNQYQSSCVNWSSTEIDTDCETRVEVIDLVDINGIEYVDVVRTSGTETYNANPIVSAYYAKGIGLVRKEYEDGSVYNLVKYEISE